MIDRQTSAPALVGSVDNLNIRHETSLAVDLDDQASLSNSDLGCIPVKRCRFICHLIAPLSFRDLSIDPDRLESIMTLVAGTDLCPP